MTTKSTARLSVNVLESREMMSVTNPWFSGNMLVVPCDNNATSVRVEQSLTNLLVKDVTNGRQWSYAASTIGKVEFQGGTGNDRFVNAVSALPVRGFGGGGNDYLEGYNAADYFVGGDGNDTLVGYGGDDQMWGQNGDDVLLGMSGNDYLVGGENNDRLNGGAGNDTLFGEGGADVLIAIDNGTGDVLNGGTAADIIWVDRTSGVSDTVNGLETGEVVQRVDSFTNAGADRTLDGDRITDPVALSGQVYKKFDGRPLFASSGPQLRETVQGGQINDCWLIAGLGAIAGDNPTAIRQNVVDFDDGTYGVRLGNNFYRVDNDLPVPTTNQTAPANAALGFDNSMWVAIAEKAYAHYRTGANSYASLNFGWSVEVNQAFGSTASGSAATNGYLNATAMANDMFNKWLNRQAVTIGFSGGSIASGAPLVNEHMYVVYNFARDASGQVTSITLRNPWGVDGAGNDGVNDGFVTVTPAQLFGSTGRINWGKV